VNRYGLRQDRIIVIDVVSRAIRLYDSKMSLKTEYPFNVVSHLKRKSGTDRATRCDLFFVDRDEYDLIFDKEEELLKFEALVEGVLAEIQAEKEDAQKVASGTAVRRIFVSS
jgi:hypothetical protein